MSSAHNPADVPVPRSVFDWLVAKIAPPAPVAKEAARTLRMREDGKAHSPFPYDVNAFSRLREDQVPRFLGALTNPEALPLETVPVAALVAMQDRVDPEKVAALADGGGNPPTVVRMDGRCYIADGHHRASAAWLRGEETIPVRLKDIEEVSTAMKGLARIVKADDEQRMVYGWASVITEKGERVIDTQGDIIDAGELVKATTEFMKDARHAAFMHQRNDDGSFTADLGIGQVIHSFPLVGELAKALGVEADREGWLVGVHVTDDAIWAAVKDGSLAAFSIGGAGVRTEVT